MLAGALAQSSNYLETETSFRWNSQLLENFLLPKYFFSRL